MTVVRSAEQEQFGAALHDLLAGRTPGAARRWAAGDRAPGLALWRRLAELGVTALAVPEKWGGLGASPLDVVIACEELGHHALPGPVAESLAAVPQLLTALCDDHPADEQLADEQLARCGGWLARLASGELIATLALPPRLPYAADADAAGLVLLAEADVVRLAVPGEAHRSVDGARSLFEVRAGPVLARGPAVAAAVRRTLDLGALASAAQLLGAGRALLEASVRHAGLRAQFGRPVGAFQAVKHQLADAAIGLEFARPLLDAAAIALGDGALTDGATTDGGTTASRDVSAAKIACADAAYRASRVALQVHGAIGYTEEHDLGLWLAKVRALVPAWGSQAEHRAAVMAALTGPGASPWT
jgi:alkylation response protein AidB-like acyl-CoA dehydrogenase